MAIMSGLVVISGMTLYNEKTDVWAAYTTEDGLASNKVTTIGVDGTEVWIRHLQCRGQPV